MKDSRWATRPLSDLQKAFGVRVLGWLREGVRRDDLTPDSPMLSGDILLVEAPADELKSLHDDPGEIPTWWEPHDRRRIHEGLVFTIEPFLSLGADWVEEGADGWTLTPPGHEPTVQYEHTLVATRRGPVILTLAA